MNKTSVKTYGVQEGYFKGKLRYFCMCDGDKTSLHYAQKDYAMDSALAFCKLVYRDFTMNNDTKVKFIFKQI